MSHHHSSLMDKTEPLSREEWQSRLENFEFKHADMNKLIMNYLVTGWYFVKLQIVYYKHARHDFTPYAKIETQKRYCGYSFSIY